MQIVTLAFSCNNLSSQDLVLGLTGRLLLLWISQFDSYVDYPFDIAEIKQQT